MSFYTEYILIMIIIVINILRFIFARSQFTVIAAKPLQSAPAELRENIYFAPCEFASSGSRLFQSVAGPRSIPSA